MVEVNPLILDSGGKLKLARKLAISLGIIIDVLRANMRLCAHIADNLMHRSTGSALRVHSHKLFAS